MRFHAITLAALTALTIASAGFSYAQPATPDQAVTATPAPPPDYRPSIADLMNIGVQPRHTKIALALRDQNWPYLAYETNELKGVFNRIVRAVPIIDRKFDTAAMIQSTIAMPLMDLADAAKAKDAAKTADAYAAVTSSCNACHQAVMHGVVVIKPPRADAYPDQDFTLPPAP